MSHENNSQRLTGMRGRRWPLFAALLGWFSGYWVAVELGQVACYFSALAAKYEAAGAPPKVAALARSLSAKQPAGMVGGFVAFVVTVFCISRGFRWLSPVFGLLSGCVSGAAVGFMIGYS